MSRTLVLQMQAAVRILSVFCLIPILGSGWALAQEPATSLDQLSLLLKKGDKITLVDPSGSKTTGRVEGIAPDALDLKVGDKVQTFTEGDIRQITQKKQDPIWNGLLIGAGLGFGATLPFNLLIAEGDEKGIAVASSALWGLIGAGIGALVDAAVTSKQVVYFRPRRNFSWSVFPFYSNSPSPIQKTGAGAFLPHSRQYTGDDPAKGIALAFRF